MIKRYENALLSTLEDIFDKKWGFIEWRHIRRWYQVARIKATPYRDLRERLEEMCGDSDKVRLWETPEGILLILENNDNTYEVSPDI